MGELRERTGLRSWIEEPLRAFGVTLALFGALNLLLGLLGGPDRNGIWVRGAGVPVWMRDVAILVFATVNQATGEIALDAEMGRE